MFIFIFIFILLVFKQGKTASAKKAVLQLCPVTTYNTVQHTHYKRTKLQPNTKYLSNYKAQNTDLNRLTVVASYSTAGRRSHIKVPR